MSSSATEAWLQSLPEGARAESLTRLRLLASHLTEKRVQFLCGAGMSRAAGFPLAGQLAEIMTFQLLRGEKPEASVPKEVATAANSYPAEAIAQAYARDFEQSELRKLLRAAFSGASAEPHAGHRVLEFFATEGVIDRVYTTNFDDLLRDSFSGRGIAITDADSDELLKCREANQVTVLHLHGHLNRDCLVEEHQTYSLDTPLARVMMADMVTHHFVWVGYSLSDTDLKSIYFSMREVLRREKLLKRPFVVLPLQAEGAAREEEWRLANKVWAARGAALIPGEAENLLPALKEQFRRVTAERTVTKIVRAKGGDPENQAEREEVWAEAEQLIKKTKLGDVLSAIEEMASIYSVGIDNEGDADGI